MAVVFTLLSISALVVCLVYILYCNGFAVMNAKSALLYVGYPRWGKRRNCIQANFVSCNGITKQIVRLSPSKQYRFIFSSCTTKGHVCVEIYGKRKELVARLDGEHSDALIFSKKRTNYRVITRFMKADGQFKLVWNEI